MSALDEATRQMISTSRGSRSVYSPVPDVTDGGLRAVFFLSFFGRIVSVLGFARRLPPLPGPTAPPTAIWGIELTVSVSTVMVEPSAAGLPLLMVPPRLSAFFGGHGARPPADGGGIVVDFFVSVLSPLSLPLSRTVLVLLSSGFGATLASSRFLSSRCSARSNCRAGVLGWLFSCTVSKVELAPLTPRAGVRMPLGTEAVSSVSLSRLRRSGTEPSMLDSEEGIVFADASVSDLRRDRMLVGFVMGGGERKRGLTGQRGALLSSPTVAILCGIGALRSKESDEACASTGIGVADSLRAVVVGAAEAPADEVFEACAGRETFASGVGRNGPSSWILFCREREPATRPEAL